MRIVILLLVVALVACGGSSTAPNPGGNTPITQTNTIVITAQGVNPGGVVVNQGTRVLFINNDTRAHEMVSDAHPAHSDCPEINQVGLLQPGQQRETGNLNTVRVCGYHDDLSPGVATLTGSITIR